MESYIDYISEGSSVTVKLGDDQKGFLGTVTKIYPDKVTLSNGQKVYAVDVTADQISAAGKLGQTGTALIQSNTQTATKLIPTWTVLNNDSVWVLAGDTPILRKITIGKRHGNMTEVVDGLEVGDQLITNPESIAANKYSIL
jgi:hypothetical protein